MAPLIRTQTAGRRSAVEGSANGLGAFWAYFAEFVKDPLGVGSPIPSFAHTVDRLLDPIDWQRLKVIVEFGPGTGRFTEGALRRMRPDATLIAIDTSPAFANYLRAALPDARLPLQPSISSRCSWIRGSRNAIASCPGYLFRRCLTETEKRSFRPVIARFARAGCLSPTRFEIASVACWNETSRWWARRSSGSICRLTAFIGSRSKPAPMGPGRSRSLSHRVVLVVDDEPLIRLA